MLLSHPRLQLHCGCKQPRQLSALPQLHLRVLAAASPASVSAASCTSPPQVLGAATLQPQQSSSTLQQHSSSQRHSLPISRPGPPEEDYTSTPKQQAIVWGAALLFLAVELRGLSEISTPWAAAQCALAAFAGYLIADFASGVYHWGVDNYGDGSTPVFGSQIVGFQGHHQWPWVITQREFCNNMYKVCQPTIPFSIFCLCISHWTPAWLDVLAATSTALVAMSQQFHGWAHSRKSSLPAAVVALQDRGVLVSRKMHGAHHRAPFEGNYCIVSGWWNTILDAEGSDEGFFRKLERFFYGLTGVEPRCWNAPKYDWEEQGSLES